MLKPFIALIFFLAALMACGPNPPSEASAGFDTPIPNQVERHQETDHQGHAHEHVQPAQATTPLKVSLVASEFVVGPNRFAVGLFKGKGEVVQDAAVHFHYYDLSDPAAPVLEMEADATPLQTPDGLTTIYTHEREFKRAGEWGVEVPETMTRPGETVTYEWWVSEEEPEGTHYFHSHGNDRHQTNHGLFGAVIVEPKGSTYLDPLSGEELRSGWAAIIQDPNGSDFREYALVYHEIGTERFRHRNKIGGAVPLTDKFTSAYKPGGRAPETV